MILNIYYVRKYDYQKKTDGWAFEIKDPAVKRILKKISPSFEYDIKTATQKDSLEINEIARKLIFEIASLLMREISRKFTGFVRNLKINRLSCQNGPLSPKP